jgi:D-sedoheptulose 7-phosphate isomerase
MRKRLYLPAPIEHYKLIKLNFKKLRKSIAMSSFSEVYLAETRKIIDGLPLHEIERVVDGLSDVRDRGGRIFFIGVGGSAANCSHAVNDFRKICGFEAYSPMDNVSEISARINDEGWDGIFREWLKTSKLNPKDCIFIMSVGGGNVAARVSVNIVEAVSFAKKVGAAVFGLVSRDGGYTAQHADALVIIPTVNPTHVTPHAEAFQGVLWHLLVSHPKLKQVPTKWESLASPPAKEQML